jgi:hypothetical protein
MNLMMPMIDLLGGHVLRMGRCRRVPSCLR